MYRFSLLSSAPSDKGSGFEMFIIGRKCFNEEFKVHSRDLVEDVFSLRVTCRGSLYERRFSPFTRSTVSVLEPDLVEQYVGGDICRYISVSEVKMALDCVHS